MLLIDKNGNSVEVDLSRVYHIERDVNNHRTLFYTARAVYHDPVTLKELETAYSSRGFHRIDKNRLINLQKVDRHEKGFLFIKRQRYAISRRNEATIRALLGLK